MKTIADFKRRLKVGAKLQATNHLTFAGRDAEGNTLFKDKDLGEREISIVQSNSFALKTERLDGTIVDSWCSYPKAKEVIFKNEDEIIILEEQRGGRLVPVLTYKFI